MSFCIARFFTCFVYQVVFFSFFLCVAVLTIENQSWRVFSAGLDRKVLSWNSPVSPSLCEVTLLEPPVHVDVSHDAVLVMTELNWYLYREVDLGVVDHGCLDALKNTDCLSRFSRGFIINESSLLFCTVSKLADKTLLFFLVFVR